MLDSIPEEIATFCTHKLGKLKRYSPSSGGCISHGGALVTGHGTFFIKWNSATQFPGMFSAEESGLKILSEANCVRVPEVFARYEGTGYACILMEFITAGHRSDNYWTELANSLACLHQVTREYFGLDHDNYIGSLPQYNMDKERWVDFFISCRLQPQVKFAFDQGKLDKSDLDKFTSLENLLPNLLVEERPALIHGDLWGGNLMASPTGTPVLIDPAVAYVHREMEMAFTRLFGGFDQEFYRTYQEVYPMETGYQERFDIYNVYPLMVHVNLFGGGYYKQVMHVLDKFI